MSSIDELLKNGVNHYSYYRPEKPVEAAEEQGDFSRGLEKAGRQVPQTFGGAVAYAGDIVGSEGIKEYGLGIYNRQSEEIAKITRPGDSFTSMMEGEGTGIDYLQQGAGYVAGQVGTTILTGGAGGFIGRQLAMRGIGAIAGKEAAKLAATNGAKIGAVSGVLGSNLMQSAGSIYPEALQQAQADGREGVLSAGDLAGVGAAAVGSAAVDTAMDVVGAGRLLKGARKPGESMLRAGAREVPGAMARETVTEGIQTGIERAGAQQELSTADAVRDYVDSMAMGALGGSMGGAASVLRANKVPDEAGPLSRAANAGIEEQILQLENDPQPLISFPDGSVGHKQDLTAYLAQFTDPDERQAKEREIMGRDPATGKRIEAEPEPEPTMADSETTSDANLKAWSSQHAPVALDYAQDLLTTPGAKGKDLMIAPHASGTGYTVVPSKWLSLDAQARSVAIQRGDEGRLPAPDREAPGGAIRVDSAGEAAPETYGEQVRTGDAMRAQQAQAEIDARTRLELGTPVPYGQPAESLLTPPQEIINAELNAAGSGIDGGFNQPISAGGLDNATGVASSGAGETKPAAVAEPVPTPVAGNSGPANVNDALILNPSGKPFATEFSAKRKIKVDKLGETHEATNTPDGWIVQPKAATKPKPAKIEPGSSLQREPASYVIKEKSTGKVMFETFDKAKVDALNTKKYEAVPIVEHLASLSNKADAATAPQPKPAPTLVARPARTDAIGSASGASSLDAYIAENPGDQKALDTTLDFRQMDGSTSKGALNNHIESAVKSGYRVVLTNSGPAFVNDKMKGWSKSDIGAVGMRYASWLSGKADAKPSKAAAPTPAKKDDKPKVDKRKAIINRIAATDPFLAFLTDYGISLKDKSDTGADKGKRGNPFTPGVGNIYRKTGLRLDELTSSARDSGFLSDADMESDTDNGGVNKLTDMIQRAVHNKEIILPAGQAEQQLEESADDRELQALFEDAKARDIDTAGMTDDQLRETMRAAYAQEVGATTADEYDAIEAVADDIGDALTAADINALARIATNEEAISNEELTAQSTADSIRQIAETDARDARESGSGTQAPPSNQGSDSKESFDLTAETADQARARIKQGEDATKAKDKAEQAATAAERDKQIKKEVAARQDASADNFQLGQSAEEGLSGQQDLLGNVKAGSQTKTAAFRKWFGDSKVVDAEGKPMVVYHGTVSDFETFDGSRAGEFGARFGNASFFSSDPVVAGGYAARLMGNDEFLAADEQRSNARAAWGRAVVDHGKNSEQAVAAKRKSDQSGDLIRSLIAKIYANELPSEGANIVPVYLSIQNPLEVEAEGKLWSEVNAGAFKRAIEGGHDGIIIRNVVDSASEASSRPSDVFVVLKPSQIKSATGNNGSFDPNDASILGNGKAKNAAVDSQLGGMVKDGATVSEVLSKIAADSKNTQFRALAQRLQSLGLKTTIELGTTEGQTFNVKDIPSNEFAAGYSPKRDAVLLFTENNIESNLLHELVHAATSKAVRAGGLAARQMKTLYDHVAKTAKLDGTYGMSNLDEFVAEAFSNPDFQAVLKGMPAMANGASKFANAWDKFKNIVKTILGLKTDSVLDQVMAAGGRLMTENQGHASDGTLGSSTDQTKTVAFRKWFGDSKVVDADGKPLVVYHGTSADFDSFDNSKTGANDRGLWGRGHYFSAVVNGPNSYALRQSEGSRIIPAYVSIKNPLVLKTGSDLVTRLPDGKNVRELVGPNLDGTKIKGIAIAGGHDGVIQIRPNGLIGDVVAYNPEQIKSAIGNNGDFDPNDDSILGNVMGDTIKNMTVTDVLAKTGNKLADYRSLGLQALGRRQLVDIYASDFKPDGKESLLQQYSDLVQRMDADKNETGAQADGVADRWGKLKDGKELAELMHDATLGQIDPAKDYQAGDNRLKHSALKRRFDALTPDARAIYTEARDMYVEHYTKVKDEIKQRITRAMPDNASRANMLKKMDDEFYGSIKGVYFPLARHGDYLITVKNAAGDTLSVSSAETLNEAEATRRALVQQFPGQAVSKVLKRKEFNAARDSVSRGFLKQLFGVFDQYEQSAEFQEQINQLYLSSLPDLSWAKHGIHRKGTPGFSQDARRAFAKNMFHGARYLAKLKYSDRMTDKLDELQDHVDGKTKDAEYDSVKGQQVVDEMNKRHQSYMNPQTSELSTTLTSVGYLFFMGLSPASAMVNLTGTPLMAFPILGGRYGFGKAGKALLEASKLIMQGKNDVSKVLTGDRLAAYTEAVNAGVIDVTQAHDLAGIAADNDSQLGGNMRQVMKWAGWMFHHVERYNRAATLVAGYDLARAEGATHEAAYKTAVEDVYASQFDYSAGNRPRIMQGNVARVLLLFKQYAQNVIYTLTRNAIKAAKGDKQAQRTLAGLLVSHAMGAGVLGLPIVGTLLAAASAIGSDDDEPWDAKAALRNLAADTIGKKPAEILMHGLSRATPFDISGRVGLDKLLLPDIQEGLEGQRAAEAWMTAALGPVAGIGVGVAKGMADIGRGDYLRGLESMLPVAIRNGVKALRINQEGVQDKTGVSILDDTTATEEIGQLLGLSPSRSREAYEGKSSIYNADQRLIKRRQSLTTQWAQAKMAGDEDGVKEIWQDIQRFNSKNPDRRIKMPNLLASVRARKKRIAESEQGIYLPKNRRGAMEAGAFAVEG